MADFIPGEAYRLDIVGADENVLVDSWSSLIKASVVARDGTLQVDVDSGKIYGPLIGDIQDIDGSVIFDSVNKVFTADVKGDVLDLEGNIVVDSGLGIVNANVSGNVIDPTGGLIVDAANRIVDADAVYGTFYGDLIGSVSTENTMFGTFSGDFNGGHYGEFFGDLTGNVTGTVTGDLIGNMTGVVTGSLIGEIMADANTSLISRSEQFNQYNWLGGINHTVATAEGDVARGPIIVLGDTRADSTLRGHVQHYDGRNVIKLDVFGNSPWPAHIHGKLRGEVYTSDDKAVLTYNSNTGNIRLKSYGILSLEANNGDSSVEFVGKGVTFNVKDGQTVRSFNGTWENKTALLPNDTVLEYTAEGYDGQGWRLGGGFGIYLSNEPVNQQAYKTFFALKLSDGVNTVQEGDLTNALIYNSNGTLKVPVTQLGETTFSQRDSMTPAAGMIIFNTSSKKFQGYTGSGWVDLH